MKTMTSAIRSLMVSFLAVSVLMLSLPSSVFAAAGIYESYVIINRDGSGNTYHKAQNGDFNNYNLGTFACGNTMVLNGAQIKTFKNNSSDITGGKLYYRVYLTSGSGGSFSDISLAFGEDYGGGNQRWETNNAAVNLLNNLGPGTYYLEVYFEASTNGTNTSNPVTDNNSGSNYKATFTVLARSKSGSGDWNNSATWEGGATPGANDRVGICSGSTVSLTSDATVRSVQIFSGGTLQDSGAANTLTLSGITDKSAAFVNAGTFSAGSGAVIFEGEGGGTNLTQVTNPSSHVFNDVTVRRSSGSGGYGVDFYDGTNRAKIDGTFTIGVYGYVAEEGGDGRPIYGTSSTLRYNSGHNESGPFNSNEEWDQQSGWTVGTSPAAPQNVEISGNDWVSLHANQWERRVGGNLTIASGSGLILQDGSSTQLKVAGTATNNGVIKQTATVNNNSFHFAHIQDTSSADKYKGVEVNSSANLGATTVKVYGNQNTSGSTGAPVNRWYEIDAGSSGAADLTFHFLCSELQSGQTPATLRVWRYNGSTWDDLGNSSNSGSSCSGTYGSVSVTGITLSGDNQKYVLKVTNPQAVLLAEFYAQQVADHVLVRWETNSELNNRGFNLYRGTSPAGPDRQLNETLIPSQAQGSPGGFLYTWEDAAELVPGTSYFYWLDDVDLNGVATRHGPVSVDFVTPTAVTLSGVSAGPTGAALPATGAALAALMALAAAAWLQRRRGPAVF